MGTKCLALQHSSALPAAARQTRCVSTQGGSSVRARSLVHARLKGSIEPFRRNLGCKYRSHKENLCHSSKQLTAPFPSSAHSCFFLSPSLLSAPCSLCRTAGTNKSTGCCDKISYVFGKLAWLEAWACAEWPPCLCCNL